MPYYTPEQRLKGLTLEERLIGLTPEERLMGLTPAEKKKLFEQLAKKYNPALLKGHKSMRNGNIED